MSSLETWQSLLKDPSAVGRLSAFELLGLDDDEVDAARIQQALRDATQWLQANRSAFDADAWSEVIAAFQTAKREVTAAIRKAPAPNSSQAAAPIRSLPEGDPFAPLPMKPSPASGAPADPSSNLDIHPTPVGASLPSQEVLQGLFTPTSDPKTTPSEIPPFTPPKALVRRRRSLLPALTMGLLIAGLFGGLLYAIKLLMDRDGRTQVAVANLDSPSIQHSGQRESSRTQRPPADSLNKASSNQAADEAPDQAAWDALRARETANAAAPPSEEARNPADQANPQTASANANPSEQADEGMSSSASSTGESDQTDMQMTDESRPTDGPSNEMSAQAAEALALIRDRIKARDIAATLQAIDETPRPSLNPEQRELVDAIKRIATYANVYADAIEDGLAKWGIAEPLQVGGREFVLVEKTNDEIIIKIDGRQQRLSRSALKLGVADVLAAKSLDTEHPTSRAYRAAYVLMRFASEDPAAGRAALQQWQEAADASSEVEIAGVAAVVDNFFGSTQTSGG